MREVRAFIGLLARFFETASERALAMSDVQMWQVQLDTGAVHEITLEQLDAAFEAGHIHERTLVREVGSAVWSTLAQVAGLEEAAVSTAPPSSMAPYAYSAYPPADASSVAVMPVIPTVNSLDLGDDLEFNAPKKKTGLIVGGIAAAVAAVAVAIGVASGTSYTAEIPKPSAPLAAAALVAPPAAAPLTGNGNPFADSVANSASRLTDEQKKALLEADQKHVSASNARNQKHNEAAASHAAPRKKGAGDKTFHKGGNQYDPLNSNL
jgi:hypothetical protein